MEFSSTASKNKVKLKLVLGFTLAYLVAEVIGGIFTNSLALLADAGHMLTDVGGLAFALIAITLGERKATPEKTYGFYRAEILAALANAVVLIFISLYILYEAWQRFQSPPEVASKEMLIVAAIGLVVNLAGMFILRKGSKESLNMKGAYFEVLSDMLTSVGVIIAGIIMLTTGWYYADPILSAGIGLFILPRAWVLLKNAVSILLEGTPSDINLANVKAAINGLPGVISVHDLHVWVVTSGINAMSGHVKVMENENIKEVLSSVKRILKDEFKIIHTTIQTEEANFDEHQLTI